MRLSLKANRRSQHTFAHATFGHASRGSRDGNVGRLTALVRTEISRQILQELLLAVDLLPFIAEM